MNLRPLRKSKLPDQFCGDETDTRCAIGSEIEDIKFRRFQLPASRFAKHQSVHKVMDIDVRLGLMTVAQHFEFSGVFRKLADEIVDDSMRGALPNNVSKAEDNRAQSEGATKSRNQSFRGHLARAVKTDR